MNPLYEAIVKEGDKLAERVKQGNYTKIPASEVETYEAMEMEYQSIIKEAETKICRIAQRFIAKEEALHESGQTCPAIKLYLTHGSALVGLLRAFYNSEEEAPGITENLEMFLRLRRALAAASIAFDEREKKGESK